MQTDGSYLPAQAFKKYDIVAKEFDDGGFEEALSEDGTMLTRDQLIQFNDKAREIAKHAQFPAPDPELIEQLERHKRRQTDKQPAVTLVRSLLMRFWSLWVSRKRYPHSSLQLISHITSHRAPLRSRAPMVRP
jgi:hypothetical protein